MFNDRLTCVPWRKTSNMDLCLSMNLHATFWHLDGVFMKNINVFMIDKCNEYLNSKAIFLVLRRILVSMYTFIHRGISYALLNC